MTYLKSEMMFIYDDDRCATCHHLLYFFPDQPSICRWGFPFDIGEAIKTDHYGLGCEKYDECEPGENYAFPGEEIGV